MTNNTENKRTAFVTGATRGIGRAAAIALAASGCHVILSGRTVGALEEVDDEVRSAGGSASILKLNLLNAERLDALGPSLYERWQKLDIIVAAAGVLGRLGPLPHTPDDIWNETLAINLTANWRLIRTLDPLLRRSDAGRAVFLSSGAARRHRAYWGAYSVSKAGLDALVKTYAHELETTPAKANLLDPGATRTKMRAKAYPGEDPETLKTPEALTPLILAMTSPNYKENGETVIAQDWLEKQSG
ncbi:MAG: SDR family NAD(P)-dependent oxidoreductase [Hyphomicrobiales bacterium]|nr:SDR family NAD(P)-dependent oxidoreductase [Hyphomicrobiales bacterium]